MKTLSKEISAQASAMGRMGGLRGGPARAQALSAQRRSQIASDAAIARWKKYHRNKLQSVLN